MLLTIAIPTYNRVEYLKELLPDMLYQCIPYPEIEILVSDNCTTDGTQEYLQSLKGITYKRNEYDVGGDENFVRCVESARGKYVWLFGDDELLRRDAINVVISVVRQHIASLVIVGEGRIWKKYYFRSYHDFIKSNSGLDIVNHSLITCNIFRKDLFDCKVARDKNATRYGHMYALVSSLKNGGDVCRIREPIIEIRKHRPKFAEDVRMVKTNQILFLRYAGASYLKIAGYIGELVKGIIMRRLKT